MKSLKRIPEFGNKEEERDFWAVHDATEYLDFAKMEKAVFPNLKPSVRTISIRLQAKDKPAEKA